MLILKAVLFVLSEPYQEKEFAENLQHLKRKLLK